MKKDLVFECLDSLIGEDYPQKKSRILVIDNASSDSSQTAIKERYSDVIPNMGILNVIKEKSNGNILGKECKRTL